MEIIASAGPWIYPLLGVALCLAGSTVRALHVIRSLDGDLPPAGPPQHPVLVWGTLAGVVGLIGTVVGVARLVAGARGAAGPAGDQLQSVFEVLSAGAVVVATPFTLGLWLFVVALLAWLALGFVLNRTMRDR